MKNSSDQQDAAIRYPLRVGLAFFSAWRVLPLANDIGLLKGTFGGPFHAIVEDTVLKIVFTLVLVGLALWHTDWLLKSRTHTVIIS